MNWHLCKDSRRLSAISVIAALSMLALSSCYNAAIQWTGNANISVSQNSLFDVTLLSPSTSTPINDSNTSSFPISGTCKKWVSNVYIFVNLVYKATTPCNSGSWAVNMNFSGVAYDSSVSVGVSSTNTFNTSVKTTNFNKRYCSTPGYSTMTSPPGGNGTSAQPYPAHQHYGERSYRHHDICRAPSRLWRSGWLSMGYYIRVICSKCSGE